MCKNGYILPDKIDAEHNNKYNSVPVKVHVCACTWSFIRLSSIYSRLNIWYLTWTWTWLVTLEAGDDQEIADANATANAVVVVVVVAVKGQRE